jgi:hypothetical protein
MLITGVHQDTDTEIRALFYLEDLLQAHVVTGAGTQKAAAELVALFPQTSVYVRNVPGSDLLFILGRLERNDPTRSWASALKISPSSGCTALNNRQDIPKLAQERVWAVEPYHDVRESCRDLRL